MLAYLDIGPERLHETSARALVSIDGLIGTPAPRGEVYDRPDNDGNVEPLAQFLGGRVVTIEGEVWGAVGSEAAVQSFRLIDAAFRGALSTDVTLRFQHVGGGLQLQTPFRLGGPLLQRVEDGGAMIRYQAQIRCPDPRHYSQTEQSGLASSPSTSGGMPLPVVFPIPFGSGVAGGLVVAQNAGNMTTWPRFVVNGPISGPVIANTTRGEYLALTSLIMSASDVLVVDTNPRSRSAIVNGSSVIGSVNFATSSWPQLGNTAAGETLQFYGVGGGYGGGTSMSVYWRSAYSG